ncbi:flagellar hook-basal body complex protein FliE [Bacterioplanoides pacificum]|uniref:Flagellar hook-basal body complex protein FliE n=1 Tax=Bacterioplanoides pacificum TaxID=1171596 RepID=A0ABV7VW77_9GAMM
MVNNRVDVNAVLMQMRQVKDQIRSNHENQASQVDQVRPQAVSGLEKTASTENSAPDFQQMFTNAINTVNENQKTSGDLQQRFEQGDPSVDLPEVMIAMQKSSVSFQAMTQVRNKLVEAYKDVMNMPV